MKARVNEIFKELTVIPSLRENKTLNFKTNELANALGLLQDAMKAMQELNTHFATDLSVVADSPMAKAVNKARAVLDRWESEK
jgi:hypothetical protein